MRLRWGQGKLLAYQNYKLIKFQLLLNKNESSVPSRWRESEGENRERKEWQETEIEGLKKKKRERKEKLLSYKEEYIS